MAQDYETCQHANKYLSGPIRVLYESHMSLKNQRTTSLAFEWNFGSLQITITDTRPRLFPASSWHSNKQQVHLWLGPYPSTTQSSTLKHMVVLTEFVLEMLLFYIIWIEVTRSMLIRLTDIHSFLSQHDTAVPVM